MILIVKKSTSCCMVVHVIMQIMTLNVDNCHRAFGGFDIPCFMHAVMFSFLNFVECSMDLSILTFLLYDFRKGSMMGMKILMMCISTKKAR